nr:PilT/PilU family type 4a pilus ATPase [uncultured Clostridium sp.]
MKVVDLLSSAVAQKASDIFLVPGMPFSYKIGSRIVYQSEEKLYPAQMELLITELYQLAGERDMGKVREHGDDDFSFAISGISRFRSSVFRQRGSLAAVIRVVNFDLPDYKELHIPEPVMDAARLTKGFVLVTGPAGSGKTTTLACIIDKINNTRNAHVITLEDPLEYLHRHKQSVVTQREVTTDTDSYVTGLRSALRQAPDVILVGEMRDYETIRIAMTAAETGHLVISTLHTVGAANTIDRIIDSFPPNQQQQIRMQLSMVMQAVISQQLIPTVDGGVYPAFEIMFFNNAIRNMIRESKTHQIDSVIATGQAEGMRSMDSSLLNLYKEDKITKENAIIYSSNSELMSKKIERGISNA